MYPVSSLVEYKHRGTCADDIVLVAGDGKTLLGMLDISINFGRDFGVCLSKEKVRSWLAMETSKIRRGRGRWQGFKSTG